MKNTLLVRALNANQQQIGDAVKANDSGSFTLTLTPLESVFLEVSNSQGFRFRKKVGKVTDSQTGIVVDATSTVELEFETLKLSTDLPGFSKESMLEAFLQGLASPPANIASGQTFLDVFKISQTTFREKVQAINSVNNEIVSALGQENVSKLVSYFSPEFSSSHKEIADLINRTDFQAVTQDRFNRYKIKTYTFTISKVVFTASDRATVIVDSSLIAVSETDPNDSRDVGILHWSIYWRLEGGKWVVYQDFPYRSEQFQNFENSP